MKRQTFVSFASLQALVGIFAMVTGCARFSNNSTAVLWTDRPELAAYAELYNSENGGRKIEVVYKEIPWMALEEETEYPELVAGSRLDSALVLKRFGSLEGLMKKKGLNPSGFYEKLFERGCIDGKCYLVPVSFTLPTVVFTAELSTAISDDYIITFEEMRSLGGSFNRMGELPTRIGYSPRWQPEFAYRLSQLFGGDYTESTGSLLLWNDGKVQETVAYAADWVVETNGGYEKELTFKSKYMYDPLYKLLDSGRILFNFMMIDEYLSVPAEMRKNLDFRWLSDGVRIVGNEDVLFIGAPKQSKYRKTAEKFIVWLFSYDTQVKLLESAQFERMRSFGIAGGLSSLISVNADALPQFYPFMHGHIPHPGLLDFPAGLPESWEVVRAEVIIPWFEKALSTAEAVGSLSDDLAQWRRRQTGVYR